MYRMLNNAQQPRVNLCVLKRYVGVLVCLYIEHITRCVYYRSLVWSQPPSLNIAAHEGSVNLPCRTSALI
jgi:hypothetical protein